MDMRVVRALQQLNDVYAEADRVYRVEQEGDSYILVAPNGAKYPPATANDTVRRLMNLANAATGRSAL